MNKGQEIVKEMEEKYSEWIEMCPPEGKSKFLINALADKIAFLLIDIEYLKDRLKYERVHNR